MNEGGTACITNRVDKIDITECFLALSMSLISYETCSL